MDELFTPFDSEGKPNPKFNVDDPRIRPPQVKTKIKKWHVPFDAPQLLADGFLKHLKPGTKIGLREGESTPYYACQDTQKRGVSLLEMRRRINYFIQTHFESICVSMGDEIDGLDPQEKPQAEKVTSQLVTDVIEALDAMLMFANRKTGDVWPMCDFF